MRVLQREDLRSPTSELCPLREHGSRIFSLTGKQLRCYSKDRYTVVFCDTDRVPALETKQGDRTTNALEAKFIKEIVDTLRKGGVLASSIGVMSVYRSQLKLLSHLLSPEHPDVEIHTADRFQGRDKDVVIISLVRSNPENYVGELLQDWRRVNVAFTRAKSKLIIFGSRSTIRETQPLDKFVQLVESRDWVCQVPPETPMSPLKQSPRKAIAKENIPPVLGGSIKKVMKVTGSAVLKGRPVLRDIVNENR
jgi:DNA replication ATP-dependent helicase Dna2